MCLLDFQSFSRKARWPGATTQTSQSGALIGFGRFREREPPVGVLAGLAKANETMRPENWGLAVFERIVPYENLHLGVPGHTEGVTQ